MKVIDALGVSILLIGIAMTVLLYFVERRPPSDIESFTIQEIPSAPHAPPAFPAPGARPL
jgi:hypothetical protein